MALWNPLTRWRDVAHFNLPERKNFGGIIGMINFSATGAVISSVQVRGCVTGVVRTGAGRFTISLWPPQPWYLPMTTCCDDAVSMRMSYMSGTYPTDVTPISFKITTTGNITTALDPSYVGVTLFSM